MAKKAAKKAAKKTKKDDGENVELDLQVDEQTDIEGMGDEDTPLTEKAKKAAKSTKSAESFSKKIEIPALIEQSFPITLEGVTSLVTNPVPEKAKQQRRAVKMNMAKKDQEAAGIALARLDMLAEWAFSVYYLPRANGEPYPFEQFVNDIDLMTSSTLPQKQMKERIEAINEAVKQSFMCEGARFGFPVVGLKKAMANAAWRIFGIYRPQIFAGVYLTGERSVAAPGMPPYDCFEIKTQGEPFKREDVVRLQGKNRPMDLRYRAEFVNWTTDIYMTVRTQLLEPEMAIRLIDYAGVAVGIGEWRVEKGGDWGQFKVQRTAQAAD